MVKQEIPSSTFFMPSENFDFMINRVNSKLNGSPDALDLLHMICWDVGRNKEWTNLLKKHRQVP